MHSLLEILKFNGGLGGGGFKQECKRANQMWSNMSDRPAFYDTGRLNREGQDIL